MKIRLVYSEEKKENLEFTDLKQIDSFRGVDENEKGHNINRLRIVDVP